MALKSAKPQNPWMRHPPAVEFGWRAILA